MANKNYKSKKKLQKKRNEQKVIKPSLFDKFNSFFNKNEHFLYITSIILATIVTGLLFDLKVSKGGDDAAYINRAHDLIHRFRFPSFQGPLWPIVLSIPIAFAGIKIWLLKLIPFVFMIAQFFYLHKAFKTHIPKVAFYPAILLTGINSYLLYYGSQTYSEALFLFIQSVFFYYVVKFYSHNNENDLTIKQLTKQAIIIGGIIFFGVLARSVGYTALMALIVFLAIDKRWKSIGLVTLSFGVFSFTFGLLKKLIWSTSESQVSNQFEKLMLKDPYYPEKGMEDFAGFIQRFIDNIQIYFSKYFFIYQGFREDITTLSSGLSILAVSILVLSLIVVFNKNKVLRFTGIYLAVVLGFTFIILQKRWDSVRLIVTTIPFLYFFVIGGIVYLLKSKKLIKFQWVYILLLLVLFIFSAKRTGTKISKQLPITIENLKGNKYYGFTPDWVNYLSMTEWVGKNVPDSVIVACRKPNLAKIYGNRRFEAIWRMPSKNADTLVSILKKRKIDYIIMANLRKYEQQKTEYTVNTIARFIYYVQEKYPKAFSEGYSIGDDEKAFLLRVNYEFINPENVRKE